jgi:hypothetical protein
MKARARTRRRYESKRNLFLRHGHAQDGAATPHAPLLRQETGQEKCQHLLGDSETLRDRETDTGRRADRKEATCQRSKWG